MSAVESAGAHFVVLVHGLGAHRLLMSPLAFRLRRAGLQTVNWGYRSLRGSIPDHAGRLRQQLLQLQANSSAARISLVTHSMGSIVARAALVELPPHKLGRIVMLAPPNQGSHAASLVGPWLRGLIRPVGQLQTDPDSFVNRLPADPGLPLGVLAARYDTVVRIESTHLPCEQAHLVVPCLHTALLYRRDVARRITSFLNAGEFDERA